MATVIELDAPSCPVSSVTVYLDRADVCRTLNVRLEAGDNEVIVRQLSEAIDEDSIRVEGRGDGTIGDVIYQEKHISAEEARSAAETETSAAVAARQELEREIQQLQGKKKELELKKKRVQKQRDVLESIAKNMKPSSITSLESQQTSAALSTASLLSGSSLTGMVAMMEFYNGRKRGLDLGLQRITQEVVDLDREITAAKKNFAKLAPKKTRHGVNTRRFVTINVSSRKGGEATLSLSYVVMEASWKPQYDLRVFSKDKQMKINYFATISQSTGEDWEDAKLFLSTATPSIGGSPPELETRRLYFRTFRLMCQAAPLAPMAQMAQPLRMAPRRMMQAQAYSAYDDAAWSGSESDGDEEFAAFSAPRPPPQLEVETAEVKGTVTSASFEIPRSTTIPADGTGHKVAVAIINLEPQFEYETVPRKVAHAFLKAEVKNTSVYALLEGPANVFLDNSFIAKTSLSSVSPNEVFTCSLGVDSAVRVVYKPIRRFREQTGMFSKSSLLTLRQPIEIKNTRLEAVKIKVADYVPLSTEEKIKVTLHRPDVSRKDPSRQIPGGSVLLNKQNILEYKLEVGAGQQHNLEIYYTVEYPASDQLVGL